MDFDKYKLPASLLHTMDLAKKMSLSGSIIPQFAAINRALASTSKFKSAIDHLFPKSRAISAIQIYLDSLPNKYLQSQAALQISDFAAKALIPAAISLNHNRLFEMDVIRETLYQFNTEDWAEEAIQGSNEQSNESGSAKELPLYLTETNLVKSIIESVWRDNQELYVMKPRDFERMTAELLRNQGFDVQLTKETRDGGYDLYAVYKVRGMQPFKILVECKRNRADRKVGIEIVRGLKYVVSERQANKGMIVTTSYFTDEVRHAEMQTPYLLECKDRDDVINWIQDYKGTIIL
jgi:restriction endonuclease Mrr